MPRPEPLSADSQIFQGPISCCHCFTYFRAYVEILSLTEKFLPCHRENQ